jgi:hypothetical protein
MNGPTQENARARPELCPSCERFIGPADECPYCNADSARAPALRVLRYAALALAVPGLFFLYLMARGTDVPLVRIGDVNPLMNFAYVRVAGAVERDAYVGKDGDTVDYVSFLVSDGTGKLRVAAYDDVARGLARESRLPRAGDRVESAGSLSVAADGRTRLRLRSPDALLIGRPSFPINHPPSLPSTHRYGGQVNH